MKVYTLKLKENMFQKLQLLLAENLRCEKAFYQKNNTVKSLENIREIEKLITALEVNLWYQDGE